jgi:uncharacterized protein
MHSDRNLTPLQVADVLGLEAHREGGYFREIFRSQREVITPEGPRAVATAIVFLLTAERPSRFHRLASDELWLHSGGVPLQLIMLEKSGLRMIRLASPEYAAEAAPDIGCPAERQALVPAGVWQAARLAETGPGSAWALATCVVCPGFEYADFEMGQRHELLKCFGAHRELIMALT